MACERHGYTNPTFCPACDAETIEKYNIVSHTSGPWLLHEQPHYCRSGDGLDFSLFSEEPLSTLMLLAPCGEVTDEFLANACLIVAAPELLEALENILPLAESGFDEFPRTVDKLKLDNAKAAIAKATGAVRETGESK